MLLRFERLDRRLEVVHWHRGVPHALEMRVELRRGTGVADDDEIVVLTAFAALCEVRGARPQQHAVDRVGFQVHEWPAALDAYIVRERVELREVMVLARIEHNADRDPSVVGVEQGIENRAVGEGVGREIDRGLRFADQGDIDACEVFLGEVDLLSLYRGGAERHCRNEDRDACGLEIHGAALLCCRLRVGAHEHSHVVAWRRLRTGLMDAERTMRAPIWRALDKLRVRCGRRQIGHAAKHGSDTESRCGPPVRYRRDRCWLSASIERSRFRGGIGGGFVSGGME